MKTIYDHGAKRTQTNAFSKMNHSGTTKHSSSTRAGSNPQSKKMTTHQAQGGVRHGVHQARGPK